MLKISDVKRLDKESELEFVQRLCEMKKDNKWTWDTVADYLNSYLGYTYSTKWYSSHFNHGDFQRVIDMCDGDCGNCSISAKCSDADVNTLNEKEQKIKRDRVKLLDERTHNMNLVRRLAREETIIEIAKYYATEQAGKLVLPFSPINLGPSNAEQEGILLLSDWHYGMVCDNYWNTYNPEICKERVAALLDKVITIINLHKLKTITVLNLSDLIAGRIHSQIRIESRFDVITQTMDVAEILAQFLYNLSDYCTIHYYDCLDNHSRLEPNKKESMDLESLVRIIPWYLKERLSHISNINIHDNKFSQDIITCEVLGHKILGVHGDSDNPRNALDRLSMMTHCHYDMLCTAHLHHFSSDEQNQSIVVSNSSLMGVDRYAEKLRLTSDPSQTLVVASKENVCECIYRIRLK